jgi:protein-tyrosine-phosphatase
LISQTVGRINSTSMAPISTQAQERLAHIVDELAEEFTGIFSRETIERYVSESSQRFSEVRIEEYVPLLAGRYARERLHALAQVEGHMAKEVPEVLFVCVHNAGRSQMAAGLLAKLGEGRVHVRTAGSAPAGEINPVAIEAMSEVGVDLGAEFPKPLSDEVVRAADVVITMGCGDSCPVYPGKRYEDWELDDPAGQGLETVRRIRDELQGRVEGLLGELFPRQ